MRQNFYSKVFFLVAMLLALATTVNAGTYSGGAGTVGDPYQIGSEADLLELAATDADWSGKHFVQTANITMTGDITPIGWGTAASMFSGTYNGQGNTITDLSVVPRVGAGDNDGVGLFGGVTGTTISNLGIENVSINTTHNRVAAIAGQTAATSTITNCYVNGGTVKGTGWVGAIVGATWSAATTIQDTYANCTVQGGWGQAGILGAANNGVAPTYTRVAFFGTVNGGDAIARNGGTVTNCYYKSGNPTTGKGTALDVTQMATQGSYVGFDFGSTWIMGTSYAELQVFQTLQLPTAVIDSPADGSEYAPGSTINVSVTATPNATSGEVITGVVLNDGTSDHIMVLNGGTGKWEVSFTGSAASYNLVATATDAASQAGSSSPVAITAEIYAPSVSIDSPADASTYARSSTVTVTATVIPSATTSSPINTVVLKNGVANIIMNNTSGNSYEGSFTASLGSYDLKVIGTDDAGEKDSVSISIVMVAPTYAGGDGSTTPYQIATASQLVDLSYYPSHWDSDFTLTADIDMDGEDFRNIGHTNDKFTGDFDGQNHVISNLTANPQDGQPGTTGGLFGATSGSNISNLGLVNPMMNYYSTQERVGGIVGELGGGSVTNCFVIGGSVEGQGRVGGIVGYTPSGAISNVFASCNVKDSWNNKGGIIGQLGWNADWAGNSSSITNAVFYGTFSGAGTFNPIAGSIQSGPLFTDPVVSNANYLSSVGAADAAYTELTLSEARTQGNYTGLTFDASNWAMATNGFAVLSSFGTKASEVTVTSSLAPGWANGTVTPLGAQTVGFGEEITFTITPNADHGATNLWVNGVQKEYWDTPASSYTFDAVTEESTLQVMFQNLVVTKTEHKELTGLKVYGANQSVVAENNTAFNYRLYNLSGKQISAGLVNASRTEISVPSRGIYILSVQDETGITTKKVLVQ